MALKCAPPWNRTLKTETPLSPDALPAASVVGGLPSSCTKKPISIMFAHAIAARVFRHFEQADPQCGVLNWARLIDPASRSTPRRLRASAKGQRGLRGGGFCFVRRFQRANHRIKEAVGICFIGVGGKVLARRDK